MKKKKCRVDDGADELLAVCCRSLGFFQAGSSLLTVVDSRACISKDNNICLMRHFYWVKRGFLFKPAFTFLQTMYMCEEGGEEGIVMYLTLELEMKPPLISNTFNSSLHILLQLIQRQLQPLQPCVASTERPYKSTCLIRTFCYMV